VLLQGNTCIDQNFMDPTELASLQQKVNERCGLYGNKPKTQNNEQTKTETIDIPRTANETEPLLNKAGRIVIITVLTILVVLACTTAVVYFYLKNRNMKNQSKSLPNVMEVRVFPARQKQISESSTIQTQDSQTPTNAPAQTPAGLTFLKPKHRTQATQTSKIKMQRTQTQATQTQATSRTHASQTKETQKPTNESTLIKIQTNLEVKETLTLPPGLVGNNDA
jgi:hypothetical protein